MLQSMDKLRRVAKIIIEVLIFFVDILLLFININIFLKILDFKNDFEQLF